MSRSGTLFGLGVGPGDPELMTLKAARILGQVPVLAHFRKRGQPGHARSIVEAHRRPGALELALDYPLTTEIPFGDAAYETALTVFYDQTAAILAAHLEAGRDVALVCEGDPFFYGSFMHIHQRLAPQQAVDVVPGVTGMSASWTRAGAPMTLGDDVLTVLPGTLPLEVLIARMRIADALVVMKLGRNFAKVRRALVATGLAERAIYAERATMPGERIVPLADKRDDEAPYFSMILVPGCGRCL
jgi:precorrin-2/cobalt-factor-2 C20-methyltransferase